MDKHSQSGSVNNAQIKVLLVEDNLYVQKVIKVNFDALGCLVDLAGTGEDAIEFAKKNHYDIILMDVGLPGIDGLEATRRIRAMNLNHETPIIAQTAHLPEEVMYKCLDAGMDAVLNKPVNIKVLEVALRKYVKRELVKQDLSLLNRTSLSSHKHKGIDMESAIQILGTREKAEDYLKQFAQVLPEEKEQLVKAYKSQDWKKMRFIAHRLHGGLCYTSVPQFKSIVKEIENAVDKNDFDAIPAFYEEFLEQYDDFFQSFDVFFAKK